MRKVNPMQRLRSLVRHGRRAIWSADRLPGFEPPDVVRARFREEGLARCARGLRLFCGLAIALLAVSAFNSYVEEPALFPALLRVRATTMCLLAGLLVLLGTGV